MFRCLLDTGAEKTLLHENVYNQLEKKPQLMNKSIRLQSASGNEVIVKGCVNLKFKVGGLSLTQEFLIVSNLNRNVILGNDFLIANKARLYFDLKQVRLQDSHYVPFENDVYISSVARLSKTLTLEPNTVYLVNAQIKHNHPFKTNVEYTIENENVGFLANQPEIKLCPSVSSLKDGRFLPIQLINTSNKTVCMKKNCIIGKLREVNIVNTINETNIPISNEEFRKHIQTEKVHFEDVSTLLLNYKDVFAFSDYDLVGTDLLTADIDTRDHEPVNIRPYRVPLLQQDAVSDVLDNMLEAGIIRHSSSPWCFPLIVVEKKIDSSGIKPLPRLVIDYRQLNSLVYIRSHPLPLIDDILSKLNNSTFFTLVDLRAGFYQIKLTDQAAEKTAFSCFKGKFEFLRMSQGLNNSPSVFQQMANKLLTGYEHFAIAYIDDILIYTKSDIKDHLKHVQIILERLRKHTLKLKLNKCSFAKKEIKYLGFVIDSSGIRPNAEKVAAIRSLKPPANVKQVRSFVGMISFYRRFIPNFSKCAEKMIMLTKKNARFKWDDDCESSFRYLKDSLTVVPLLFHPDVNKPYILYVDASHTCIGACLIQEVQIVGSNGQLETVDHPIYFLSHKLTDVQIKGYSTVEKEAFCIHYTLNKLHFYLHNARFIIKTDHQPLKFLFTSTINNRKIQSWAVNMNQYNCEIEYVKGSNNIVADLLSRSPPDSVDTNEEIPDITDKSFNINVINSNQFEPREFMHIDLDRAKTTQDALPTLDTIDLPSQQDKDKEIIHIKQKLRLGITDKNMSRKYLIHENILYYISQVDDEPILRLYVPTHLRSEVLQSYHTLLGHMGQQKCYSTIREKYYWPLLFKDIYEKIDNCVICKKRNMLAQQSKLIETPISAYPFAVVSIDLSGPHKQTISGNNYIISFIDHYSGWVESYPLNNKRSETIVNVLLEEIIPRHSTPLQILTDNGSEFTSASFKDTLKHLRIVHSTSSPYHPEGHSKIERLHQTLNHLLAKKMNDHIDNWDIHINSALLAIRTNVSETTKKSPFFLLYNRLPVLPLDNLLLPRRKYHGDEYHKQAIENYHKTFLQTVKYIRKSKIPSKKDSKRKEISFNIGDHIYYRNHRKSNKLENNWITHFIIVDKTGPVNYIIRNQLTGRLTRAHVNSLRPARIQWKVPKLDQDRSKPRNAQLAEVPPSSSDTSGSENEIPSSIRNDKINNSPFNNHDNDDFSSDSTIIYDTHTNKKKTTTDNDNLIANQSHSDSDSSNSESTIIYDPNTYKKNEAIVNEGPSLRQLQTHLRFNQSNAPLKTTTDSEINSDENMEIDCISQQLIPVGNKHITDINSIQIDNNSSTSSISSVNRLKQSCKRLIKRIKKTI